jgi:hypothetical protein
VEGRRRGRAVHAPPDREGRVRRRPAPLGAGRARDARADARRLRAGDERQLVPMERRVRRRR